MPGPNWEFCWVSYHQPHEQRGIAGVTVPTMARFDPLPLQSAIVGLISECAGPGQPLLVQKWAELIHAYVLRLARPREEADRLSPLWERVAASLGDGWSLARLAHEAGYSNEHLRRLSRRQVGRSPMHQVTYLRMRRAAQLLASTELTVQAIAHEVGYQNPFVFSNAFTRWIGWRPSEFRRNGGNGHARPRANGHGPKVLNGHFAETPQ
jgi:AraC-like DNA-binding protein